MKNKNIQTLGQFKDEYYGKPGTRKRDELDAGYESFRLGVLLKEARLKKGMTQEQLAEKTGTTKSYISKIENDVKEARLSTIHKIVEVGLGGKVDFSISL